MKLKATQKFQLQLFPGDVFELADADKAERVVGAGVATKVTRSRAKKQAEPKSDDLFETIGETVAPDKE